MRLTENNWKEYFRTKMSGYISKKLEDRIVKFINKVLKAQKVQLERSFKNDKGKQKKLL